MFDVAIIGAGPGGYVAAIRAAQLGLKTVCIEKRAALGGTCLNVGCIPSKALLHSSELFWKLQKHGKEEGIECAGLSCNFQKMQERKDKVVLGFVKGIEGLFKKHKIERIEGSASFKNSNEIEAGGKTISAKHIILATGSEPIELPFLPFDEKRVVSSTGALAFEKIPKKLLVVGAGIIGVELGSVYRRLGSEVVFLEFLDRICPSFDRDLSKALEKSLSAQGLQFHLSHKVLKADLGSLRLTAEGPSGEAVFDGDAVLVCVGRRPFTKGLRLDAAGVKTDAKGVVLTDANFRTSQPHIFAIGDLVEGPMLAHKASEEGCAVAELIAGHRPQIDVLSIPSVAYTYPEVAAAGLTQEEAVKRGLLIKTSQFPFKANSRARCTSEDEGFVKLVSDAQTGRLLGAHIIGPNASELIAEAVLAIRLRASVAQIAETSHAHPTLAEAIKEAALAAGPGALHL